MNKINLNLDVTARFVANQQGATQTSTTKLKTIITQGLQRVRTLTEARSLSELAKKIKTDTEIEVSELELKFVYNICLMALDFDGKLTFATMLEEYGVDIAALEGTKPVEPVDVK